MSSRRKQNLRIKVCNDLKFMELCCRRVLAQPEVTPAVRSAAESALDVIDVQRVRARWSPAAVAAWRDSWLKTDGLAVLPAIGVDTRSAGVLAKPKRTRGGVLARK